MRIRNNIAATNTHRLYAINNDNIAKAAEKLSSGYRINRAGDDAAGLAISEKMRSQIRGLNMAVKNSQDAISLVQTAEGALQETHAMLQRMNELAVQAATGTNQEFDRAALAKEFEQLKREINDVAEQTTFNDMKILDGSLSRTGYVRSAATAGVTNTVSDLTSVDRQEMPGSIVTHYGSDGGMSPAVVMFDLNGLQMPTDGLPDSDQNVWYRYARLEIGLQIDGKTMTYNMYPGGMKNGMTAQEIAAQMATVSDYLFGSSDAYTSWSPSASGTEFILTSNTPGATNISSAAITHVTLHSNMALVSNVNSMAGTVVQGTDGGNPEPEVTTVDIDVSALRIGDAFTLGLGHHDQTVVLTEENWDSDKTINDLAALLGTKKNAGTTIAVAGDKITITQDHCASPSQSGYVSTSVSYIQGPATESYYTNTIEFDVSKLKEGDEVSVRVAGTEYTYVYAEGSTGNDVAQGLASAAGTKLSETAGTAKGNAIIVRGPKLSTDDITLRTDATHDETRYSHNALRIQVGALENEQLSISIESMNTAGLKLDDQNLHSQNAAGRAITAVRSAINQVSDQHATLGAMQNRLDHKIANLKVSSENLSAAESRIRDVDMASEMTNFTKNTILSQAATAMLAQANSLPQNVLSLLG